MGLFHEDSPENHEVEVYFDAEPGLFYEVDNAYVMFLEEHKAPFKCTVGIKIVVPCMFDMHLLMLDAQKVGYWFTSQFQVINGGGYLCTYLHAKKALADTVEVLAKTDELVIYNFSNRGTLIVSPRISAELKSIFGEQ